MESSDPGEFSEAWVGWWQMRCVITVTACYRKTEFKRMFYWRFFWFVANHVPYIRLDINSKLNFYWLHGYKIFDDITNIGRKGTSFSAEKKKKQQFCAKHRYQLIRFLFWREHLHDAIKLTISTESYIYILHTYRFFLNTARLSRNSQRRIKLFGDHTKSQAAAVLNFSNMHKKFVLVGLSNFWKNWFVSNCWQGSQRRLNSLHKELALLRSSGFGSM